MPSPNPQAVEAVMEYRIVDPVTPAELREERPGDYNHLRSQVEAEVKRAEPHIRSQLLTELAEEEFDSRATACQSLIDRAPDADLGRLSGLAGKKAAYEHAAEICRDLAAKEGS